MEPSDADLKAAVEGLHPKSDSPAVEGAGPEKASAEREWVPEGQEKSPVAAPAVTAKKAPAKPTVHVVKKGETLNSIAARHGVTIAQLKAWNPAKLKNGLQAGSKLSLASSSTTAVASAKKPAGTAPTKVAKASVAKKSIVKYKVKPGDNLIKIAKQHATTPEAIQRLNGLKGAKLVPGAVLVVKK